MTGKTDPFSDSSPSQKKNETQEFSDDKTSAKTCAPDLVLLHSPTKDGQGVNVVRARGSQLEIGELRALEPGKPLHGEVVSLTPRAEHPALCDVKVEYASPSSLASSSQKEDLVSKNSNPGSISRKGPPLFSTSAYRENWDSIFKASDKKEPGPLN